MLYTRPPNVSSFTGDIIENDFRAIVIPVFKKNNKVAIEGVAEKADSFANGMFKEAIELGQFKGEVAEILKIFTKNKVLLFVGLGELSAKDEEKLENMRRAYAVASGNLKETSEKVLFAVEGSLKADLKREAVIGALLGSYALEKFKKEKKTKLKEVYFNIEKEIIDEATAIAEGVYLARDLANAPPNEVTPSKLVEKVKKLFKGLKNVEIEVYDYKDLVEKGFGGIVSVGKGSDEKPRLLILKYKGGRKDEKSLAVVGKTIVFDSGGINLKPSQSLFDMRADKAGGATALGVFWTIVRLSLPLNIVVLMPAAINVPSGSSYLPSDVIRMWDGTYVEVTNTDAEGRLTLADALAYAAKELDAKEIIDLATLTGAAWIALGPLIAAYFTRDEELSEHITSASKKSGEKIWRLPLEDSYKRLFSKKAPVGDIANAVARAGGAITAALFLERFIHGKPWIHLDIAGPGIGSDAQGLAPEYWPHGIAPGFGVRLLVEYIKNKTIEN